jgi:hypothetical protein
MFFQRLDLAKEALKEADSSGKNPQRAEVLNTNLMMALTHNEPEFVNFYLEQGATTRGLEPSKSFKITDGKRPLHTTAKDDQDAESVRKLPAMAQALEELYTKAAHAEHTHVATFVNTSKYLHKGLTSYGQRKYNVLHMERLMQELIGGGFSIARMWSIFTTTEPDEAQLEEQEQIASHALFVSQSSFD